MNSLNLQKLIDMDTVCKNIDLSTLSVSALTSNTLLDSASPPTLSSFQGLPTYDPSALSAYSYTIGTKTYSAKIFSILKYAPANRYALPTGTDYWTSSRNTALDTAGMISTFTSTNVDGKTYKIITPKDELTAALTGTMDQQKTAVSYDFLYSLQFEFCYWAKIYRVLIGDFIKVQNIPTNDAGTFTTLVKTGILRQLVNALNSVNLRLTDLTKIAQAVADAQRSGLSDMNTQVNQFLKSISDNVSTLEKNRKDLSSADVGSRLKARMLEYSEEKNAYANQMLALYGFANLIAVGLLFYIYRS